MNMKNDNLEDLFKNSFENFEAEVNPNVWKNIQAGIKEGDSTVFAKFKLNKIGVNAVVAIVSSIAAIIGTVLVMNFGSSNSDKTKSINSNRDAVLKTTSVSPEQALTDVKVVEVQKNVNRISGCGFFFPIIKCPFIGFSNSFV